MNEDIDSGIFEGFGDNLLQALERSIDFDDEFEDEEIYWWKYDSKIKRFKYENFQ